MFLFDTMVLSETFKRRPDANVVRWLTANRTASVHISVLSVGEITRGICKLEPTDPQRAEDYRDWMMGVLNDYRERMLPITVDIMQAWGVLTHRFQNTNPDLLIAATALVHDLTVVTRNLRHFEATGVRLFNPYDA